MSAKEINKESDWGLEWWYNAHFTFGVIQNVFIPILIPTFVLETTGSVGAAGVMLAIIGLSGLTAPIIGAMADKYEAHRWVQLVALLAYAVGGLLFAYANGSMVLYYAASACFGIGSATLLMINPVFIVAAGFTQDDEARRLARMNQTLIFGQLLAGLGLAAVTSAGLSFQNRFLMITGVALVSLVLTAATNKKAAQRIQVNSPDSENNGSDESQPDAGTNIGTNAGNIKQILLSVFGLFLLAVMFGQFASSSLSGQFPTYMQQVFSIDPTISSATLSVSSVVSLIMLGLVGRWMAKSGPAPVWLTVMLMYMAAGAALIVLSAGFEQVWQYLPLAIYIIYLQALAWQDMVTPALAARASTAGAATTQGFLLFVLASGYALVSVLSAETADIFGFTSLAWIVLAGAVMAFFTGRMAIRIMSKHAAI